MLPRSAARPAPTRPHSPSCRPSTSPRSRAFSSSCGNSSSVSSARWTSASRPGRRSATSRASSARSRRRASPLSRSFLPLPLSQLPRLRSRPLTPRTSLLRNSIDTILTQLSLPVLSTPPTKPTSLRSVALAVVASQRMQRMARAWKEQSAPKKRLRDQLYQDVRGRPFPG